eukprot:7380486-Prymnesium_polylepis.1
MPCPPSDLKLDLKRITWGSHWRVIRSGHTGGQTGGGRIGEAPRVTRSGSHGDHMRGHTAGHTGGVTWGSHGGHMGVTWWSHGHGGDRTLPKMPRVGSISSSVLAERPRNLAYQARVAT